MIPQDPTSKSTVQMMTEQFENPVRMRQSGPRKPRPNSLELLQRSGIVQARCRVFNH